MYMVYGVLLAQSVWIVGDSGNIRFYNGSTWTTQNKWYYQ